MTTNQITTIIAVISFIAIGTAFVIWDRMTPYEPPTTAEQSRLDSYYRCVDYNATKDADNIAGCNSIK